MSRDPLIVTTRGLNLIPRKNIDGLSYRGGSYVKVTRKIVFFYEARSLQAG